MAFCNSCGATLAPGTKFCSNCGVPVTGAGAAAAPIANSPTSSPGPAAPTGSSSAVKMILIVVAVVVAFGILGVATLGIIGVHIAKRAHVLKDSNRVKVETPFGSVDTTKDPQEIAKDLGVEIYPGAQAEADGATSATFGSVHTASASFISNDPLDKVCDFYKSKFPNAMATTSDRNRCTIVSNDQKNMITVNLEANGRSTKIQISNVTKSSTSSN